MKPGRTGFELATPEELREISRKGGKAKNPKKGFGSLTKKQRSQIAKKAAKARWGKREVNNAKVQ